MAKKTENPYKNLDLQTVKTELVRNVSYLSTISIEDINDDIEWFPDFRGVNTPQFTSKVEEKLDLYIILVKDSIEQLYTITRLEDDVSDFVTQQLDILEEHLKMIEGYFERRPPESVVIREHNIEMVSKKGYTYTIRKMAANIPTQIRYRSKAQKIITALIPIITEIRENKRNRELGVKGSNPMSPSMMLFLMRKENETT